MADLQPGPGSLPKAVDVYTHSDGRDMLAGRLYSHRGRRAESATFTYADSFLADPRGYELDPALPMVTGAQQTSVGLPMFRAFADSAPDRWGRRLIARAEGIRAERDSGTARTLSEFTYLLGVRDDLRQGALRFAAPDTSTFLATDTTGVPALTDLPKLLDLAQRAEDDDVGYEELRTLLRAGSSLGGARPKAHVRRGDGRVAIAKFPSAGSDVWHVMAWEKTTHDLARAAGITVPDSELLNVAGRQVHIIDRFDRVGDTRVGYVSAMTMLEARDGDVGSYLDIAAVIEDHSSSATAELRQLWKRVAFSVLVSNTDDHLRNHGFLHGAGDVWTLSPAFDLNPDPSPGVKQLATAIDADDTTASIDLVMRVAPLFRLGGDTLRQALAEVTVAAGTWRKVAAGNGLSEKEISQLAPAFEHREAVVARSLIA
ncbi:MAG: type II toxin-antitoxin system HipA family toxin [Nocardioidaceae bacterium]